MENLFKKYVVAVVGEVAGEADAVGQGGRGLARVAMKCDEKGFCVSW